MKTTVIYSPKCLKVVDTFRSPSETRTEASPDYARDLNPSEIWVQKKSRSSLI